MKKWYAALILALLVALLTPLCASAAPGPATEVTIGGVTLNATYPYLNESLVRSTAPYTGDYAYFNAKTGTLELHNFTIAPITANSIETPAQKDLTIVFYGSSSITNKATTGPEPRVIFVDEGTLTLTGESGATLTLLNSSTTRVKTTACGIETDDLIVTGGTVTVTGSSAGNTYGIYCKTYTQENGTITATGGSSTNSTSGKSVGLYCSGKLQVTGGSLNATGGSGYCSYGLNAAYGTITGSNTRVYAAGLDGVAQSFGIYSTGNTSNVVHSSWEVADGAYLEGKGGSVSVKASTKINELWVSCGIYVKNLVVNSAGTQIVATGGSATGSSSYDAAVASYGLNTQQDLTLHNGTITATGGETICYNVANDANSYGASIGRDLLVTGGKLNASVTSNTGNSPAKGVYSTSKAISASTMTVSGGEVNATVGDVLGLAYGIYIYSIVGELDLSGTAKVTATVGEAYAEAAAVYVFDTNTSTTTPTLTLSGNATLTASTDTVNAQNSTAYGVHAYGITVTDSAKLDANAGQAWHSAGIKLGTGSSVGTFTVTGGTISATGGFSVSNSAIRGQSFGISCNTASFTNCTVTAKGGGTSLNSDSAGYHGNSVTFAGTTVGTFTGGTYSNALSHSASYGIYLSGSMAVKDSASVTATGGKVYGYSDALSAGIYLPGTLTVNSADAKVVATGNAADAGTNGEKPCSYGILTRYTGFYAKPTINVTAGELTAQGGEADGDSAGIQLGSAIDYDAGINVSGGKLTAAGAAGGQLSAGILFVNEYVSGTSAKGTLNVSGGEAVITAVDSSTVGHGLYAWNDVYNFTVSGGKVTVKGGLRASGVAPDVSSYPRPLVIVSNSYDGRPVAAYNAQNIQSYRYLTIDVVDNYILRLSASPAEGGTVSGAGTYFVGQEFTLTATPNPGYRFVGWYEGSTLYSNEAGVTDIFGGPMALEARFALIEYTVSVTSEDAAKGSAVVTTAANSNGCYPHGTSVTVTATPETGHEFIGWYEGEECVCPDAEYTFFAIKNTALTAKFQKKSYEVLLFSNNDAYGTVTGGGTYDHGSEVTFTATPNEGYHFARWGTYVEYDFRILSTDNPYTFIITKPFDYYSQGTFVPNEHTITVSGTSGGAVVISPDAKENGTYDYHTDITVTATPDAGYAFVGWYAGEELVSADAEYAFKVTGDADLTARFSINYYTVSVIADPEACGTVTGEGSYAYGSDVTLTAVPSEGYHFVGWYDEDGNKVGTETSFLIDGITGDLAFVAKFAMNEYEITAESTPGGIGLVSGSGTYVHGSEVSLAVSAADPEYIFTGWYDEYGACVTLDEQHSFIATGDAHFIAVFTRKPAAVNVIITPPEGGTVTGSGEYAYGSTATLTATPSEGYHFVGWYEETFRQQPTPRLVNIPQPELLSTDTTYSFEAQHDRTIIAMFELNEYDVIAEAEEGGSATGSGTYPHGTEVTLTATPGENHYFSGWYDENGRFISDNAVYTFTATKPGKYIAKFNNGTCVVTLTVTPPEGGTVTGAGEYTYGDTVQLAAIPCEGYVFVGWCDANSVQSDRPVAGNPVYIISEIRRDMALVALFEPIEDEEITPPATGDNSAPFAWLLCLALSTAAILLMRRRRTN